MSGTKNSGRRPKPIPLRVYEGNLGKRPIPEELKTRRVAPECPKNMPPAGRECWEWLVRTLGFADVLSERDWGLMNLASRHYDLWQRALGALASEEMFYQPFVTLDDQGQVVEPDSPKAKRAIATTKEHPALKVAAREAAAFRRCLSVLGVTPTDWVKLSRSLAPNLGKTPLGLLDVDQA